MAPYVFTLLAVVGISAVCPLTAWIAWLIFNWCVFKSTKSKTDVFANTAKVAESFGRSKVADWTRAPAISSLRRQSRQEGQPPSAA